jgi:hypothetical protein
VTYLALILLVLVPLAAGCWLHATALNSGDDE